MADDTSCQRFDTAAPSTRPGRSILDRCDRTERQRIRDAVRKDLIQRLRRVAQVIETAKCLTTEQRELLLLQLIAAEILPPEDVD